MFAERLAYLLEKNKLSRAELADKLGVTVQSVGKWIRGEGSAPDYDNLYKLRRIFDVSADYLLGYDLKDSMEAVTKCNYSEVAEKVKSIRESKRLSKRDFAIFNDVKTKDIEEVEAGKPVNLDILKNIAFFSGVSFYELLGQENKPITTDDAEYRKILSFAANFDNKIYIEKAMKIKESGVPLDEVVISRKLF